LRLAPCALRLAPCFLSVRPSGLFEATSKGSNLVDTNKEQQFYLYFIVDTNKVAAQGSSKKQAAIFI
jgi:hypothetical protein